MIKLTPLEETVAGQELIQIGIEKGFEKGELIGEILVLQDFLKSSRMSKESLIQKSMKDLKTILKQLEAKLSNA